MGLCQSSCGYFRVKLVFVFEVAFELHKCDEC